VGCCGKIRDAVADAGGAEEKREGGETGEDAAGRLGTKIKTIFFTYKQSLQVKKIK
jgi:hypothetical protein